MFGPPVAPPLSSSNAIVGSISIAIVLSLAVVLLVPGQARGASAARESDWPAISEEERNLAAVEQDPEADAIVLLNERRGKIVRGGDDWVNALTYHWRLKVLTEAGKRYGEVRIRGQKFSRVSNIRARTIRPDGTIVPVAQDEIFEKVASRAGAEITEWVFSFPAVEQGAILEYRYDRHDDFLMYLEPFYFEGPEFTLWARVSQAIPDGTGYSILCALCAPGVKPKVDVWREYAMRGEMYTMELRDLPGYKTEILMPPRREASPRVEMVLHTWKRFQSKALGRQDKFFIDWPSVARFAGYYYDQAMKEGLAEIKPLVERWIEGITDPQEKVKAILQHVRMDFRYVPWDSVVGRSRPIKTILRERLADNEEKAVVLRAALKIAGFESHSALVVGKDTGSLNPNFFSLSQFTHVVIAVPLGERGYQFLDPTVSYAPFGFVPWKDSGASAFLIKDGEGELITLPTRNEVSMTRFEIVMKPHADGRAQIDVDAEFRGEDAIDMRENLAPASEEARESFLQEWIRDRQPGAALVSYAIDNAADLDVVLKVKMQIESTGLVMLADDVMLVRGCVLSGYDANPISRGERRHPFYVDRGWNTQETVTIEPPEGMEAAEMPAPAVAKSGMAKMTSRCSIEYGGGARCSRQFVAQRNRWHASEIENLRRMYEGIVQADRSMVVFRPVEAEGSPPPAEDMSGGRR